MLFVYSCLCASPANTACTPNQAQVRFLENQLLYNAALQERRDAWKVCRKSIHYYDQAKQLKPIREEGLLGLANFSCCQDVLRRLDKTFQAFLDRKSTRLNSSHSQI